MTTNDVHELRKLQQSEVLFEPWMIEYAFLRAELTKEFKKTRKNWAVIALEC